MARSEGEARRHCAVRKQAGGGRGCQRCVQPPPYADREAAEPTAMAHGCRLEMRARLRVEFASVDDFDAPSAHAAFAEAVAKVITV